jgi:beta-phosphoglucomutase
MIKAIIYDLDGVLVDATEWHYESLNLALNEIAGFTIKRQEHIDTFNGIPTIKKLEILNSQGRLDESLFNKIWELKQDKTIDVIKNSAFNDDVKIRLHENTKQYKKCCVTNSIQKTADLMLEKTGQKQFMEFLISNEDVLNPKPDPEGYITAMNKLCLEPDECMIIEDSPKGIKSANESGAFVYPVFGYADVTLENVLKRILSFNNY